jgi:hypothetical protein
MKTKLLQKLSWVNIEQISEALTPLQFTAMSTVLTQKGTGNILCIKCNEMNLVRDGIFWSNCGYKAVFADVEYNY